MKRPFLADVHVRGEWGGVDNWWLNPWTTFDSYWYLTIASSGYEPQSSAFFPLFPVLLKYLGHDMISRAAAGVVISHLSFLVGLYLVFRLTEIEHDRTIAHITVWTLCFIPSAAFFGAVYTESLFLALMAGTFLAARQERWVLCSLLAAMAALTRNPGVLLSVALAWEIWKTKPTLQGWLTKCYVPLAPLIAFCLVQGYYWWTFGDPVSGVVSQEFFHRKIMWPWQPLLIDFLAIFQSGKQFVYYFFTILSLFITALALFFLGYGYRKIPKSYLVMIGGIKLMNLVFARILTPVTISGIRYMGALFPFSQLLGIVYFKARRHYALLLLMVGLQLFAFIFYSYYMGYKIAF